MYTFLRRHTPLIALFVMFAGLLTLAGCSSDQSTLQKAKADNYVTIGFANEAPYGFADESGNVTGEAPEVAKAVLAKMGIDNVDGVVVPFGSLIPGLQAGRFDIIAAGMFINPDRCDKILFSDPDYAIPEGFAVPSGDPDGISTYSDVANSGVQLGVMSGAVEEGYAKSAGVPDSQLTTFDNAADMAEALTKGRIDAMSLTTLSLQSQLDRLDANSSFQVTNGFFPVVDGKEQIGAGGYGFRKEDQDFRDQFNDILDSMKQNDQIMPITQQFGFGANEIGAAKNLTADQLCSK